MRWTQVLTRASPRKVLSRVATFTRISWVASSASSGCQSIRCARRRTSSATSLSSSSSACLVAADGGGDQLRRNLYRGHAVSRCALSTDNSRASSVTCASKTSSGMPGAWCIVNVYTLPASCVTTRVCAGTSTPGAGMET